MLKLKELPYLLTLLFAVLGYTVKEMSEEILSSTFIEYKYEKNKNEKGEYLSYHITNISKTDSYKNLIFTVRFLKMPEHDFKFIKGSRISKRPTYHKFKSSLDSTNANQLTSKYANFEINYLIPGSKYELRLYYLGELIVKPDLLFNIDKMVAQNPYYDFSNPPVYIRQADYVTYLAKNKISLYLILISIWIGLILFYLKNITHEKNNSNFDSVTD